MCDLQGLIHAALQAVEVIQNSADVSLRPCSLHLEKERIKPSTFPVQLRFYVQGCFYMDKHRRAISLCVVRSDAVQEQPFSLFLQAETVARGQSKGRTGPRYCC